MSWDKHCILGIHMTKPQPIDLFAQKGSVSHSRQKWAGPWAKGA